MYALRAARDDDAPRLAECHCWQEMWHRRAARRGGSGTPYGETLRKHTRERVG
jgi:hypothetical protein